MTDSLGFRDAGRPTVGQMMMRDLFMFIAIFTPMMMVVMILFASNMEPEDPSEAVDVTGFYMVLAADIVIALGLTYWRWNLYSSVLQSGVETPGEVTSVTQTGDTVSVEWTYRWQAETIKSNKLIGGFIPKRRLKYEVGLKATLLVDPRKPERFMVLDTVR